MFMYDAYETLTAQFADFQHFTIDDVDETFERFVKLKYRQKIDLLGFTSKSIYLSQFISSYNLAILLFILL